MAAVLRIVSAPVRVTPPLRLATLATLVTADVLAGAARAAGYDVESVTGSLAGGLSSQYALERELSKEGHDRTTIGRDAFVERVRTLEAEGRDRVCGLLDALGVAADLDGGAIDGDAAVTAARTAFVRLFEEGRLAREERVVATCPRCETVLDAVDVVSGTADAVRLTVRFLFADGEDSAGGADRAEGADGEDGEDGEVGAERGLDVAVLAPELLPGVAAVAVPEGNPRAGRHVIVPLAGHTVPVLGGPDTTGALLVVPAHDARALEAARQIGLPVHEVLGWDGAVVAPGPLAGLTHYAARQAAAKLLVDEGFVVDSQPEAEPVGRCRRCGTVVVPRAGWHWFLDMADLEVAAADRVRQGEISFSSPAAREEFLARAGEGGEWCLSQQVWAGQPVPVSTCLECKHVGVSVDPPESCGVCMGSLAPDESVLDVRFVAAAWLLSTQGWPADRGADRSAPGGPSTLLLVGPGGIGRWALPLAAIGLRLAGSVPFDRVAVHEITADDHDPEPDGGFEALVGSEGCRVLRAALEPANVENLIGPVLGDCSGVGV